MNNTIFQFLFLVSALFTPHLSMASVDFISGKFSISPSQQVHFASGNLQYLDSTKVWRFAEHQWDYIGKNNETSITCGGWIDLFGWGTGNNPTNTFWLDNNDYVTFSDWGINLISDEDSLQWHTLTNEEWEYVFNGRKTESGIRFAKAVVNGVNGVILVPDNWSNSIYRLRYANKEKADYSSNNISTLKWNALEMAGAVFLPAAGYRRGTEVYLTGLNGYYWSSTVNGHDDSYGVFFINRNLLPQSVLLKEYGFSVRLVCSAE